MTFQASSELTDLFYKVKKKLVFNFFFCVFVILIYAYPMYTAYGKKINLLFIGTEIFLLLFIFLVDRSRTVSTALTISRTATEVEIFEDHLIIRTAPIKVLFWINRPAFVLRFNIREFSRRMVMYPQRSIYDLDNKVWKLDLGENIIYILTDYFDIRLKEDLENFLYWKDVHAI